MNRISVNAGVALVLGMGLALALVWALGTTTLSVAQATGLQHPVLQGNNVLTVCLPAAGTCPFTNVQAAVDAAHDGDVVKVAAGTYMDVWGRPVPAGFSGPSIITQVVYVSKTVAIRGGYTTTNWVTSHPATQPTTLDAQGQGRVFVIVGEISPTIESLRITGGDAQGLAGSPSGEFPTDLGGGVYVVSATATISNCWVHGNTVSSGSGGGVYLYESDGLFAGNTVLNNTASVGGGLCLVHSDASVVDNTFASNVANAFGGGVSAHYSHGSITGNTVISNVALGQDGGGLYLSNCDARLCGNTVISNMAPRGGGLYLSQSNDVLSGTKIISNTASRGGGLAIANRSNTVVVNAIIASNRADESGSGVYVLHASPRLLHTTVARNGGGDGSGIYITHNPFGLPPRSMVALTNTILVNHAIGISVTGGNTVTINGILWDSSTPITVSQSPTAAVVVQNGLVGVPAFVNAGAGDYHIGASSDAFNRGVTASVTTDMDGEPRLGAPDLGADEYVLRAYLPMVLRQLP